MNQAQAEKRIAALQSEIRRHDHLYYVLDRPAVAFAAAVEASLSSGYIIAQYFGWSWGKFRTPAQAPRFHAACLITVVLAYLEGPSSGPWHRPPDRRIRW